MLTVSLMLAFAHPAQAQSIVIPVNTADDEFNEDGDCSLREAVGATNTDAPVDACRAGSAEERDDRARPGPRGAYHH